MSQKITIENCTKRYEKFTAVNNISLTVEPGEFFTLLGPSGCGKTTLLRMIAGFNEINEGKIYFGDQVINDVPAYMRNIGMVFQNYAIFPHLTVRENVAYGLKARKLPKDEIDERTEEAMKVVKIEMHADKQPSQLSGGQQQRVALARAIVIRPQLLLMDEPLSNLDAKLRVEMRSTIRKLQRDLGITTIYVTHDQEEALAISDRIAVMNAGEIEQIGAPYELYTKPKTKFVNGFLGTTTFMEAKAVEGGVQVLDKYLTPVKVKDGYQGDVLISVRPEKARFMDVNDDAYIKGVTTTETFLGDFINYTVDLENGITLDINEYLSDDSVVPRGVGTDVRVKFEGVNVFIPDGKEALA